MSLQGSPVILRSLLSFFKVCFCARARVAGTFCRILNSSIASDQFPGPLGKFGQRFHYLLVRKQGVKH